MHSSRMLTVRCSGRLGRGECLPQGCLPGGCLPRGCLSRVGVCPGDVSGKGCLPRPVCGWGVYTPSPRPIGKHPQTQRQTPLWTQWQTPVPNQEVDAPPVTEFLTLACEKITFPQLLLRTAKIHKGAYGHINQQLYLNSTNYM